MKSIEKKPIKKIDAIIILANLMDQFGSLNPETEARANKAIDLYFKLESAPCLVTCGWAYRSDNSVSIAVAIKNFLLKNYAINANKIYTEINSRDTVGDAYFTKINFSRI